MPTKHYGAYVGTPKSTTNGYAGISNIFGGSKDKILVRDYYLHAATPINDTVQCGIFKSATVLNPNSLIRWAALGAGSLMSLGDATHATALMNAVDTSAAGSKLVGDGLTLDLHFQPLWKALGYATDPGGLIELIFTITGGAATGKHNWQITGQDR